MLEFDRVGQGPQLVMLHGTTSSREVWRPLLGQLEERAEVIAIDLPGHGQSSPTSFSPPEWAREVAALLDSQGFGQATLIGHSSGGWTALELAKMGKAAAVVALAPAGLWAKQSPMITNCILAANWRLGRLFGPGAARALRLGPARRLLLGTISAKPGEVNAAVAIKSVCSAIATDSFPRHFAETRRLRFCDGQGIEVPIRLIWGAGDRVALATKSRFIDQLPSQTMVETWPDCGHMVMWDCPDRLLRVIDEALGEAG